VLQSITIRCNCGGNLSMCRVGWPREIFSRPSLQDSPKFKGF
jgi:hypothetical protein